MLAEPFSDVEAIEVDMALRQSEYAARAVGSQFPDGGVRFLGLNPILDFYCLMIKVWIALNGGRR